MYGKAIIDYIVEIAELNEWELERTSDDQVAFVIPGQWHEYSFCCLWSERDETFRLICTVEMSPPEKSLPGFYSLLNLINDRCWGGTFSYWAETKLLSYRYGYLLTEHSTIHPSQIAKMIGVLLNTYEHFYPIFQLVNWGGKTPEEALESSIPTPHGQA